MSCGVIHKIKNKVGSISKFVRFINSTYGGGALSANTIDCDNFAYIASSKNDPTFTFQLIGWETKITAFTFRMAAGCAYPKSLALLAWDGLVWKQLCTNSSSTLSASIFTNYTCVANSYYSSFQLKQLTNSQSITYIEFVGFELQGSYRRIIKCTQYKNKKRNISMLYFIITLLLS